MEIKKKQYLEDKFTSNAFHPIKGFENDLNITLISKQKFCKKQKLMAWLF